MAKNYITPEGAARLRAELKELLYEKRPEVVKTVAWAASNGDRSENGDYIYGKRRLREIDRRIRFLQGRLEAAEVVDPGTQGLDRVRFGVRVVLEYEDGAQKAFEIVGVDEANPSSGRLSWNAPLVALIMNKQVGDVVTFKDHEIEVIKIERIRQDLGP